MAKATRPSKVGKSNKVSKPMKKKLTKSTSKATKSAISKLNSDEQEIDSIQSLLNNIKPEEKKQVFNATQLKKDLQVDNQNRLQKKIIAEKMNQQLDLLGKIGL